MKKLYLLTIGALLGFSISAQTFSDNFDSYTVGDYLGNSSSNWTTWSGSTGGSEDVKITDVNASSAPNSIYFGSTSAGGGPQDVVLNFGGVHNVGQFTFAASFFVETGKKAYFNFQANAILGEAWALNCFMENDGYIYLYNDGYLMFQTPYSDNKWFDLKIDINLSINQWDLYIDDVLKGTWVNTVNQVASIDIYPADNYNSFYVDNVSYNLVEYTLPSLNGSVISIDPINGVSGQKYDVNVQVRNLGTSPITSYDLTIDYNGIQNTENITNVNIASLATVDYTFTVPVTLVEGEKTCVVTISNVNGGTDEDASDDAKTVIVNPIVPAPGKIVLSEEATGTWCQWCPKGAVSMDRMEAKYHGFWVGVSVHNGDPMTETTYDAGISSLIAGYPSALVDRGAKIDPSEMEIDFMKNIIIPPTGTIINSATYNETTGELEVLASIEWKAAVAGSWKIACVISEDSVTGSTSSYDQSNSYAGGGNGEMGGFESLPNPVPAADMIYRHVARSILPDFNGAAIEGADGSVNGDFKAVRFSTTIQPEWDVDKLSIVTILIKPDGTVDNVGYATLAKAIENTYVGIDTKPISLDNSLNIYPNPTNSTLNIEAEKISSVQIYDISGKLLNNRVYSNENMVSVNISSLETGIYYISVETANGKITKKIMKN